MYQYCTEVTRYCFVISCCISVKPKQILVQLHASSSCLVNCEFIFKAKVHDFLRVIYTDEAAVYWHTKNDICKKYYLETILNAENLWWGKNQQRPITKVTYLISFKTNLLKTFVRWTLIRCINCIEFAIAHHDRFNPNNIRMSFEC